MSAHHRLYGSAWVRARAAFLKSHPLCVMCLSQGLLIAADTVDHIKPHRGDLALFWDQANWQPLCKPCHDGPKREQEFTGTLRGCDTAGVPTDDGHHWNCADP